MEEVLNVSYSGVVIGLELPKFGNPSLQRVDVPLAVESFVKMANRLVDI
jgi:hypothetical protein